MLQNYDVDIKEFIKITNSGIVVADFVQVRDALIRRYKQIYGQDIDLSTASVDGVFVNDLALIINNILQSYKILYSNMNVDSAKGIYLDNICSLTNIKRKSATYSTASLIVTNLANTPYNEAQTVFVDKEGTLWYYNETLQLDPYNTTSTYGGYSKTIIVQCENIGPVDAPIGWITQTINATYLQVEQPQKGILGETTESDSDLRARRAQTLGVDGITVLQSLQGALLEVSGIKDVKIYNNNTGTDSSAKDGVTVDAHSEYIILRYLEGTEVDNKIIGNIIYQKLTPGILTSEAQDSTDSEAKQYTYSPSFEGMSITDFDQNIYWKKALPVAPQITITIKEVNNFESSDLITAAKIIKDYCNNLKLSIDLTEQDLLIQSSNADPGFLGNRTYNVTSINIQGSTSGIYTNPDTYYNYTTIGTPTEDTDGVWTITIS